MKKIKVFLASSVSELRMERLLLSEYVGELNDLLIDNDKRIQLFMCEHFNSAISLEGKQNEYNKFIKLPCDIFINLFYSKAGEYTVEEYNVALETNKMHGKPKMFAFFKSCPEAMTENSLIDFKKRAEAERVVNVRELGNSEELKALFKDTLISAGLVEASDLEE